MQLCSLEEDNVDQNCGCRTVGHPEPKCPDTHDTQVRGWTTVCVKATNDNWRAAGVLHCLWTNLHYVTATEIVALSVAAPREAMGPRSALIWASPIEMKSTL